jgi:hypothetical protein
MKSPLLKNEKFFQDKLLLLSTYSPHISFKQEVSLLNSKGGPVKTRRFDIVQDLPHLMRIYELKKETITIDLVRAVLAKSYIELAQESFNKPIELVFTSPSGITATARDLIEALPNTFYISTRELSNLIYRDYVDSLIPEAQWHSQRVREEFRTLLR